MPGCGRCLVLADSKNDPASDLLSCCAAKLDASGNVPALCGTLAFKKLSAMPRYRQRVVRFSAVDIDEDAVEEGPMERFFYAAKLHPAPATLRLFGDILSEVDPAGLAGGPFPESSGPGGIPGLNLAARVFSGAISVSSSLRKYRDGQLTREAAFSEVRDAGDSLLSSGVHIIAAGGALTMLGFAASGAFRSSGSAAASSFSPGDFGDLLKDLQSLAIAAGIVWAAAKIISLLFDKQRRYRKLAREATEMARQIAGEFLSRNSRESFLLQFKSGTLRSLEQAIEKMQRVQQAMSRASRIHPLSWYVLERKIATYDSLRQYYLEPLDRWAEIYDRVSAEMDFWEGSRQRAQQRLIASCRRLCAGTVYADKIDAMFRTDENAELACAAFLRQDVTNHLVPFMRVNAARLTRKLLDGFEDKLRELKEERDRLAASGDLQGAAA